MKTWPWMANSRMARMYGLLAEKQNEIIGNPEQIYEAVVANGWVATTEAQHELEKLLEVLETVEYLQSQKPAVK